MAGGCFKPECGDCPLSLCRGDFHLYVAEAMCSDLGNHFPLHIKICNTLYSFSEIPFAVSLTIVLCDDGLIPPGLAMHLFLCRLGVWVVPLGLLTEREVVFNTSDVPSVLFLVSHCCRFLLSGSTFK